jgi:hypothetical protein
VLERPTRNASRVWSGSRLISTLLGIQTMSRDEAERAMRDWVEL